MADLTTLFDESRLYVDNLVSVTLTRPASPGKGSASITVDNVQDQPADEVRVESPMGTGSLVGTKKRFRMWLVECQLMPPHEGYEITTADNRVWAIQEVEPLMHGRAFRCHCSQRRAST